MKKGFTPLEIMIGLAIATLLSGLLMQSLYQLTNTLTRVDQTSALDMRVIVFKNLLEKELAGAFVPELLPIEQEKKEEAVVQEPEKKETKKTVTPEKAFYSQNSNGQLELLTFITTNPLAVYNMAKAHSARIVYTLVADNTMPGAFVLMRKEVSDIMQKEYQASKGFSVVTGIKSLTVEFLAVPEESDEKQDKNDQSKELEKKKTFKRFDRWDQNNQEQKEQKLPAVPQFIIMQLTLYNQNNKTESTYRCIFAPCYGYESIALENRQSLSKGQQQSDYDPLQKVMEKNSLSNDLQSKLNQWGMKNQKESGATGPVLQGVKP